MTDKKKNYAISRRGFMRRGAGVLGVAGGLAAGSVQGEPPASWRQPGAGFSNYGQPRDSRVSPIRWISADRSVAGNGVSWTPLHQLEGIITPNGPNFERHYNGVPDIDPATRELGIHGLVSCCEWTGVPLSSLLDEAGVEPAASWLVADGLDAAGVTVSIPLEKAMDDILVALYQNGEPLRPENGFPAKGRCRPTGRTR